MRAPRASSSWAVRSCRRGRLPRRPRRASPGMAGLRRRTLRRAGPFRARQPATVPRPPGACHQEAVHVPAAVADRIVERAPTRDGGASRFDVRTAIDESSSHVDVVVAGRPMQRRLRRPLRASGAGISTRVDQQPHHGRPVREVSGPVGDHVQRRTPGLPPGRDPRVRQAPVLVEQRGRPCRAPASMASVNWTARGSPAVRVMGVSQPVIFGKSLLWDQG
jgi:hypothetical protein